MINAQIADAEAAGLLFQRSSENISPGRPIAANADVLSYSEAWKTWRPEEPWTW